MIRFDDSNILSYKLVYLNSWTSISTQNAMREELATAAIAIAIISKSKNTARKRKQKTVWVRPWLCRIILNSFKNFCQGSRSIFSGIAIFIRYDFHIPEAFVLQPFCSESYINLHFFICIHFWYWNFLPTTSFKEFRLFTEDTSLKNQSVHYQSITFLSLYLIFVILFSNIWVMGRSHFTG